MRYVITKDQFHKIVYNILDEMMEGGNVERENNPYVKSGNTYRLNISNKNGENFLTYFFYEPGEDDDGNPVLIGYIVHHMFGPADSIKYIENVALHEGSDPSAGGKKNTRKKTSKRHVKNGKKTRRGMM